MFARIISVICIAYVAFVLLAPPCVQERVDANVAMLSSPCAHDAVVNSGVLG